MVNFNKLYINVQEVSMSTGFHQIHIQCWGQHTVGLLVPTSLKPLRTSTLWRSRLQSSGTGRPWLLQSITANSVHFMPVWRGRSSSGKNTASQILQRTRRSSRSMCLPHEKDKSFKLRWSACWKLQAHLTPSSSSGCSHPSSVETQMSLMRGVNASSRSSSLDPLL